MMHALNRCNLVNICNSMLIGQPIWKKNLAQFKFVHKYFCYSTSSSENCFKKGQILQTPSLLENDSDTFGKLQYSLETSPKKISENSEIIRIKKRPNFKKSNEANRFGNLSDKNCIWFQDILEDSKVDNDQSDDSYIVRNISRKYRDPKVYLERMKDLVKEKKLKEALDLFVEMRRNHVNPTHPQFTFMIGACGKLGYTEMAFKLFRQMTDRAMEPTPATLTGLFNSCAESCFPEYGLKKARALKEKIAAKNWKLTHITYHAMIKAFGKCGDIQSAFQIVDEMAANDIKIDVQTYSFLLMSCIADKESGFTHAFEVWRKMKKREVINEFSCNLFLRAIRDCDIGPEEISSLILERWSRYSKRPYGFKAKKIIAEKPVLQIQSGKHLKEEEPITLSCESEINETLNLEKQRKENIFSNLVPKENSEISLITPTSSLSILSERPENASLDLENIKTSYDRLNLVGGAENFLKEMKKLKIKPSIKTITLLLECLPPYFEEEEKLVYLLDSYNVTPDIGFCNILMKRRIFRHENSAAKQVLVMMSLWGVSPDIITFGILATGCRHYNQALSFLNDLEKLGFCPNIEIAGALVSNACTFYDFKYLHHILILMKEKEIEPNEKILIKIDKTLANAKKNIINMEHKKEVYQVFKQKNFSKVYLEFCEFYNSWLQGMTLEKEKDIWTQYKTEIVEKYIDEQCQIVPR